MRTGLICLWIILFFSALGFNPGIPMWACALAASAQVFIFYGALKLALLIGGKVRSFIDNPD